MGGTGSGRWTYHEKQRTVEECWAMSISEVDRVVDFSKPGSISHLLRPTLPRWTRLWSEGSWSERCSSRPPRSTPQPFGVAES
jgi:hypothetical protein